MKTIKCKCGRLIKLEDNDFDKYHDLIFYCNKNGYSVGYTIWSNNKVICRVIIANEILPPPVGYLVDHKDNDSHNMLHDNLRVATESQNAANRVINENTETGCVGVYCYGTHKKLQWRYGVMKGGKTYRRSGFNTIIEAIIARDKKAIELFGEFAKTNLPMSYYSSSSPSQSSGGSSSSQGAQPSGI